MPRVRYEVSAKAYRSAYPLGQALTELPLIPAAINLVMAISKLSAIAANIVFFEDSNTIIGLDSRPRNQYRELESTTD